MEALSVLIGVSDLWIRLSAQLSDNRPFRYTKSEVKNVVSVDVAPECHDPGCTTGRDGLPQSLKNMIDAGYTNETTIPKVCP